MSKLLDNVITGASAGITAAVATVGLRSVGKIFKKKHHHHKHHHHDENKKGNATETKN